MSGTSTLIFSKSYSKIFEILLSEIDMGVPLIVIDSFVNSSKQKPTFSNSYFKVYNISISVDENEIVIGNNNC